MSIKQQFALQITCDCPECRNDDCGPIVATFTGNTPGECYKTAVNAGWRFLKEPNEKMLAVHIDCLGD